MKLKNKLTFLNMFYSVTHMQDQENNIAHLLKKLIDSGSKKEYIFFFKQYHEADIAEGLS